MEAAKAAVNKIVHRSGQHTTEVDEDVNQAVTSETVKPHQHEETTQAVDREVHQHHYHTTVQPLTDKEVLPEQHTHRQAPVQEREFVHGDTDRVRGGVEAEAAKFRDTSTTQQTTTSASEAPVVAGEHVHHHVHERVQPVVHKETIAPEVVHTTVPIHETHHAQAEHHGMSTLPTKTLDEFNKLGGKITGGSHRHEEYEGHPRPYNPELQTDRSVADRDPTSHDGLHGTHDTTSATTGGLRDTTGTTGSNVSGLSTAGGYDSSAPATTGTALGGRTEGNTASRALDAATTQGTGVSHHDARLEDRGLNTTGTTGTTGLGSEGLTSRSVDYTSGDKPAVGTTSHERDNTDTYTSTDRGNTDTTRHAPTGDVQTPGQGKDPSLVEEKSRSGGGLRGEGVDGSHSAVFGLTPDGHKHTDTSHGTTPLKPAHSKDTDRTASGDTGSRAPVGSGVAEQMHDPRVAEPAHGGSAVSTTGSAKPGAGAPGGEQGLGQIRPGEHGAEDKAKNKLDPTTDADGDGKRGVFD